MLKETKNEKQEKKKEENGKEEKKEDEKKEEEPQEIVLKVDMHCEACARKVARALRGFQGLFLSISFLFNILPFLFTPSSHFSLDLENCGSLHLHSLLWFFP